MRRYHAGALPLSARVLPLQWLPRRVRLCALCELAVRHRPPTPRRVCCRGTSTGGMQGRCQVSWPCTSRCAWRVCVLRVCGGASMLGVHLHDPAPAWWGRYYGGDQHSVRCQRLSARYGASIRCVLEALTPYACTTPCACTPGLHVQATTQPRRLPSAHVAPRTTLLPLLRHGLASYHCP